MKNLHIEQLRRAAKNRRHRRNLQFKQGILVDERFEPLDATQLSWSASVTFILNDYLVDLRWMHPRLMVRNRIRQEACEQVDALQPDVLYTEPVARFSRRGRSRKSVTSWVSNTSAEARAWYDAVDVAEQALARDADVSIAPSYRLHWSDTALCMTLCAPIEIRSEADLHALAHLAKRILKREISFHDAFSGAHYGRADWVGDGLHLLNRKG